MKAFKISFIVLAVIFSLAFSVCSGIFYLKRFTFNEDKPLEKWNKMILNREVTYIPIKYGNEGFIRAVSIKACSALYYRLNFKLNEYPLLSWKWKVVKFPDLSFVRNEKDRDDFAARVYVIFPFLNFSMSRFIEYVWAEDLPAGAIIENPLAKNVKLIVVRSGKAQINDWLSESRNVYEDYVKAFGEKPRRKVGAIAMMCDADSSKSEAESLFDEITITSQPAR